MKHRLAIRSLVGAAAGLALALTVQATPAFAVNGVVSGPGCPQLNRGHDDFDTHGTWSSTGGDYTGSNNFSGNCNGTSYYVLTSSSPTYLFRWHAVVGAGTGVTCDVQTYIPTENAGDPDAVYKIYADNGSGGLTYLGQRGPYNQEKLSGWLDLGNWTVVNNYMLTVILSNQSGVSPGAWYVGAGDMSWNCDG